MKGHAALLSALVKCWRPETHTFHLSVAIFLVSRLMGRLLPVDQTAVTNFWWRTALPVLVGSPVHKITCWRRLISHGSGGAETLSLVTLRSLLSSTSGHTFSACSDGSRTTIFPARRKLSSTLFVANSEYVNLLRRRS
ncbi:hypothetical protein AHAS_Ahas20G0169600 [Arachis hypogaea]